MDFVNNLDTDTSLSILSCLDDPSDIVRASAVSRSWRQFVIKYSLSKNLCLKLFHQLSNVDHIVETSNDSNQGSSEAGSSSLMDTRLLEKEHRAYALLARGCMSSPIQSCIADAIIASSTDNFPAESILNTLEERDRIGRTPSYWSSTGQHRTSVPETLLYRLNGDLCVITEINIQPFQAYFQRGRPIYSSHYVRFRLGHHNDNSPNCNNSQDKKGEPGKSSVESNYVWTYTSQEFPMAQENRLQSFKLPEPVLCIGGYILVEFLGRVQTQEMDGQYYICVSHVKVEGRSLAKSFRVENVDDNGKFGLKALSYSDPKATEEMDAEAGQEMDADAGQTQLRNLEQLLNLLHRHPLEVVNYVWPESDDEYAESEDEA
ncbi:F-box domain [Arabidopsis thaliana x Arabidopsis arenosa]|uniref:F-box domain n=1 Tax=Arabidopsis thaliana x Arabidopsis arenosa TaxID=1240361 RepID=A0A8T1Z5C0_9BRAS|nr:F-box domain [Arabidopsis thaliana x Arabidopsis arenosa]